MRGIGFGLDMPQGSRDPWQHLRGFARFVIEWRSMWGPAQGIQSTSKTTSSVALANSKFARPPGLHWAFR